MTTLYTHPSVVIYKQAIIQFIQNEIIHQDIT